MNAIRNECLAWKICAAMGSDCIVDALARGLTLMLVQLKQPNGRKFWQPHTQTEHRAEQRLQQAQRM